MKNFYGIIELTTTREEEYEKKLKSGKVVTKKRDVTVTKDVTVEATQPTRIGARNELEDYVRGINGATKSRIKFIGKFA